MSKGRVGTRDVHHRLPGADLVPVPQRMHLELAVIVAVGQAELEDGDCLVQPGDPRASLPEHLHRDRGIVSVHDEEVTCPDEVLIRVVAGAHLLDRKLEDGRIEPRLADR